MTFRERMLTGVSLTALHAGARTLQNVPARAWLSDLHATIGAMLKPLLAMSGVAGIADQTEGNGE